MNTIKNADMPEWAEEEVERVLEWYEKDPGDALVGEEVLERLDLEGLRDIFAPDMEVDPFMQLVYEVEPQDVEKLQGLVDHRIDLAAYDYFVAAYEKED